MIEVKHDNGEIRVRVEGSKEETTKEREVKITNAVVIIVIIVSMTVMIKEIVSVYVNSSLSAL